MKKTKVYKSGLTLIVERNNSRAVGCDIVFTVGSIDEKPKELGFSHFLEHMIFKSTTNRTTNQIADEKSFYGISSNGATSVNKTYFYFGALKENFEKGLEIQADCLLNTLFDEAEFETEKKVVFEEIDRSKDNTDNRLYYAVETLFRAGTPLSHNVIGKKETIEQCTPTILKNYKKKHYVPKNVIISICGGISFYKAQKLVKKYFKEYFIGENKPAERFKFYGDNKITKHFAIAEKDEKQVKIKIKFKGIGREDPNYYAQNIYGKILGDGFSSRLFKKIRTELGLVYQIYSDYGFDFQTGVFIIGLGLNNSNVKLAMREIKKVLKDLAEKGITDKELQSAKNRTKASFAMSSKTTNTKTAISNASFNILGYKQRSDKQILKMMNDITKEQVNTYAKQLYANQDYVIGAIGKDIKLSDLKVFKII